MSTPRLITRTFRHNEVLWVLVALLALLLVLAMTKAAPIVVAEEPVAVPRLMPDMVDTWTAGVKDFRVGRVADAAAKFERLTCEIGDVRSEKLPVDHGLLIWNVLVATRQGDFERVAGPWNEMPLAPAAAGYRHVALAAIYLERGDLENAATALTAARELLPDNAIVHYYTALYRLGQAANSRDWPDCLGPTSIRLAAYRRPETLPMTASVYELAAAGELERAIELAPNLDTTIALIPANRTAEPYLRATVNDLLIALGAERFEANSHNMLGHQYLNRHSAEVAEEHLDHASKLGANVLDGYQHLAGIYAEEGRYTDAARADLKSMKTGPAVIAPAREFIRHLTQAALGG